MRTKHNWFYSFLILVFITTIGCKAYKPVVTPALKEVPANFTAALKDSAGIGNLEWRNFF